jgi:hypothetical protein
MGRAPTGFRFDSATVRTNDIGIIRIILLGSTDTIHLMRNIGIMISLGSITCLTQY